MTRSIRIDLVLRSHATSMRRDLEFLSRPDFAETGLCPARCSNGDAALPECPPYTLLGEECGCGVSTPTPPFHAKTAFGSRWHLSDSQWRSIALRWGPPRRANPSACWWFPPELRLHRFSRRQALAASPHAWPPFVRASTNLTMRA